MKPSFTATYIGKILALSASVALIAAATTHAQIPQNGLIAHWDFNGDYDDNTLVNPSLNGTDINYSSSENLFSPTVPPGGGSSSATFDGTNDYVDISSQILPTNQFDEAWTASAWFKADSAPSSRNAVFETSGSDNYTMSLGLRQDSNNTANTKIQFFTKTNDNNDAQISIDLPDSDVVNKWIHGALTYEKVGSARILRAYVNGQEIGHLDLTAPVKVPDDGFHIGTHRNANGRFFDGLIDEVAIWNRALDPAEIFLLSGAEQRVVSSLADSGAGTLRAALATAPRGTLITFDPSLDGKTITLASQLDIVGDGKVIIDASSLPAGITIDANQLSRVMEIKPGVTASLHGLTLTGGNATGTFPASAGGAVFNDHATLSLSACTLSGNSADTHGGGIYSDGRHGSATLSLSACTLSGNSADFGGGISSNSSGSGSGSGSATLSLSACTLSGNSANDDGGGIFNNGFSGSATLSLNACTLSGNSADVGGGISSNGFMGSASLSLSNTILAGNIALTEPDLREAGTGAVTTASGNNLIGDVGNSGLMHGVNGVIVASPKLAPLGHYGGPTQTMPPIPGSPAIDAATSSTRSTDQRGIPIVGTADIGAVEIQDSTDTRFILNAAWDTDTDGDGNAFGVEFALGTDPFLPDADHPNNLQLSFDINGDPVIDLGVNLNAVNHVIWILQRSPDLQNWTDEILREANPATSDISHTDLTAGEIRQFYRFAAELSQP